MTYPTGVTNFGTIAVDGATLNAGGETPVMPNGVTLFVDSVLGNDSNNGSSETPLATVAQALSLATTGSRIYLSGDIREEVVGSNLKFDITFIGLGSLHHPDLPAAGYHPGACMWRPPASPTTATPLLKVRGRGWKFYNIVFDAPVDSAAVYLERNALEGTAEYDASHARFEGCLFRNGKYGIQDVGGCHNVVVRDCEFFDLGATGGIAITCTSTAVALPFKYRIEGCNFPSVGASTIGNLSHLVGAYRSAVIKNNVFGKVVSTAKYIDLTGGEGNVIALNVLGGVYDTGDYVGATADLWYQNAVAVVAVTAPDGVTLSAPAAP